MVRRVDKLEKEVKRLKKDLKKLRNENASLNKSRELNLNHEVNSIETKEKNQYKYNLRKSIFCMLSHNVPVDHIPSLIINITKNISNKHLSSVPGRSTCCQMAYEMSVLSDLQTGEAILASMNMTIGLDGTTVQGQHISEIHIMSTNMPYLINLVDLPGGTAVDYAKHATDALEQISRIVCSYIGGNLINVCEKVLKSISNIISDRAAVNGKVVRLLRDNLQMDLLEYKCNLHPLDSIAGKCRETLKKFDKEKEYKSQTFGNSCCVANIVYGIPKMR